MGSLTLSSDPSSHFLPLAPSLIIIQHACLCTRPCWLAAPHTSHLIYPASRLPTLYRTADPSWQACPSPASHTSFLVVMVNRTDTACMRLYVHVSLLWATLHLSTGRATTPGSGQWLWRVQEDVVTAPTSHAFCMPSHSIYAFFLLSLQEELLCWHFSILYLLCLISRQEGLIPPCPGSTPLSGLVTWLVDTQHLEQRAAPDSSSVSPANSFITILFFCLYKQHGVLWKALTGVHPHYLPFSPCTLSLLVAFLP